LLSLLALNYDTPVTLTKAAAVDDEQVSSTKSSMISDAPPQLSSEREATMALYKRTHAAFEAAGATRTRGFANLLMTMGLCLGSWGKHNEAMAYYRQSKEVYEAAGAAGTPEYADLLRSMAARLRSRREHLEAAGLYREARAVLEAAEPPSDTFHAADGDVLSARDPAAPGLTVGDISDSIFRDLVGKALVEFAATHEPEPEDVAYSSQLDTHLARTLY